jgi:hypothetical protein
MTTREPVALMEASITFGYSDQYTLEEKRAMLDELIKLLTDLGITYSDLKLNMEGTSSTTHGPTSSTTHGPTSSTTHGPTPSFPGTTSSTTHGPTPSFPGTTSFTTHGPTPSFPGPTPSVPSTTPSFNFSVDVIANEIARGANIVQWGIIEDELTAERIDAIKNIINDTINNS